MYKIFLTLCYYEYPSAKAHLDFWELAMKDRIKTKIEKEEILIYVVKRQDEDLEIIYCIRLSSIPSKINNLVKDITCFEQLEQKYRIEYLKTLIFGKVTVLDLNKTIQFTNQVEDFFRNYSLL